MHTCVHASIQNTNMHPLLQGLLESIEVDVRNCFDDCPYSVFETTMDTGFGRMLVHAVAQYLGLESFSE